MVEVHQLNQQNVVELVEVLGGVGGANLNHYACSALGSIAKGSKWYSLVLAMARMAPSIIRILHC